MRKLFRGSEIPGWWISAAAGVLACFVLFFRLGDSGLWDPWEMNQEIMARQVGGPAQVLVVSPSSSDVAQEIQALSEKKDGLHFSWVRDSIKAKRGKRKDTSETLSQRLIQAKQKLSGTAYHALIIPLEPNEKLDDEDPWPKFAKEVRSNLPGSFVILIGASERALQAFGAHDIDVIVIPGTDALVNEWDTLSALPYTLLRVHNSKGVFALPPLKFWLVSASHSLLGPSEFSSRLPSAILGLLVLMIVFFITRSLAGPWAALLAVVVLLSTPYLTVQARSMGGEIGFIAYLSIGVLGLHLSLKKRWIWAAILVALGFTALLLEKGLFGPAVLALIALGLASMGGRRNQALLRLTLATWLALAVCFVLVLAPDFFGDSDLPSWRSNVVGVLMGLATLLTSFAVYASMAGSEKPQSEVSTTEGDKATLALWGALITWVLTVIAAGALLRTADWSFASHLRATSHPFEGGPGGHDRGFDFFMLQTGFAFLPWIILVPFALGRLAQEDSDDGASRSLIILWAAVPFVVLCASILHLGHSVYPGGPAFAVAIAVYASYLYRKKEFTALHVLFILLGLYLLRTELKLSPHPLVGTITWDPSFVFAFKEIHRGVLYPEVVRIPDLYRSLCLLFVAWLAFSAIRGSVWMERLRSLSRSSRFYFFVLASLLFTTLIPPVVTLLSYVQGNAALQGGEPAYHVMRQVPVVIVGTPAQIFLVLLLLAYVATGIARSRWAIDLLYKRSGFWNSTVRSLLSALGWLPGEKGGMVSGPKRVAVLIGCISGAMGLFALALSIFKGDASGSIDALKPPLVCLGLVSLLVYSVVQRALLKLEVIAVLWGTWILLWGASAFYASDIESTIRLQTSIAIKVVGFIALTRLWPVLFQEIFVRRSVLIIGILIFGLQILLGLGGLTDGLSNILIVENDLGVQRELGMSFIWRPELVLLCGVVAWTLMGWIRMGPPLAEKFGANRLILGLGLLFVLCGIYIVVGASLASSPGVSQVLRGILWIPLLLLVLLICGIFVRARPQIERWKESFVALTQKLEHTTVLFAGLSVLALGMMFILLFKFVPQLGHHVSQKHLLAHYQSVESRSDIGSDIFRYGQFSTHTGEENLYAGMVPNVRDTSMVLKILDSKSDLHVSTGARGDTRGNGFVFLPTFDAENDKDSDGVRDWDSDWGIADSIENKVLVDESKSWRPDQWKGALLIDGTGRPRQNRLVSGNTATKLTFTGPPVLRKPGAPDNWYKLDHPDAVNHSATSMRDSRAYVVFPVRDFSELNFKYRRKHKGAHIPVLDDRSSRQLLLTNALREGEEDRNWLSSMVLSQKEFDGLDRVQKREIVFDDKIVLVGIKFEQDMVWRTRKARITFFFKVKAGLAKSWKIFVHVDRVGGARLGADHWVANLATTEEEKSCTGCFKTNHWIIGDIVADTFEVDIPLAHAPGLHHVNMGIYDPNANQRLRITDVKPPTTHNGDHRVRVGSFVVR
jgi:4-amino-4-deoxy-L-arabinose transferase-like glycosyltransferase